MKTTDDASKLTPWHEMPTPSRTDIIDLKTRSAGDLDIVRVCGQALDGESAAIDVVGAIIRRAWRDAEIAEQGRVAE
jgi:hypothetical protein